MNYEYFVDKKGVLELTNVELTLYNILGQRVKTIIANETKVPGRYEISFKGNSLVVGTPLSGIWYQMVNFPGKS